MTNADIARQRLHSQHLTRPTFEAAVDAVRWLVAVQSQDYAGAKWALGLRSQGLTDPDVDRAFNAGAILRTHVMRPTWHFVAPEDIRWLLALTAPRVHALNATYYRKLELDDALLARSQAALANALQGGQQLTRAELGSALAQAGIVAEGLRLGYIAMRAELDALVCSGARRGKQFTYALLEERAPLSRTLDRDEALAELSLRYYQGRGPATVKDFSHWSGLTVADAKAGVEMVKSQLAQEVIDGQTHWLAASTPAERQRAPSAHLLPNYDEYISSYADRSAVFDSRHAAMLDFSARPAYPHFLVMDGMIVGLWKRTLKKETVIVELSPFTPLSDAAPRVVAAAQRYGEFLGLNVVLG